MPVPDVKKTVISTTTTPTTTTTPAKTPVVPNSVVVPMTVTVSDPKAYQVLPMNNMPVINNFTLSPEDRYNYARTENYYTGVFALNGLVDLGTFGGGIGNPSLFAPDMTIPGGNTGDVFKMYKDFYRLGSLNNPNAASLSATNPSSTNPAATDSSTPANTTTTNPFETENQTLKAENEKLKADMEALKNGTPVSTTTSTSKTNVEVVDDKNNKDSGKPSKDTGVKETIDKGIREDGVKYAIKKDADGNMTERIFKHKDGTMEVYYASGKHDIYRPNGHKQEISTDNLGNRILKEYDEFGKLIAETDYNTDGKRIKNEFISSNGKEMVKDTDTVKNGVKYSVVTDEKGNPIGTKMVYPNGNTETQYKDGHKQIVKKDEIVTVSTIPGSRARYVKVTDKAGNVLRGTTCDWSFGAMRSTTNYGVSETLKQEIAEKKQEIADLEKAIHAALTIDQDTSRAYLQALGKKQLEQKKKDAEVQLKQLTDAAN